MLLFLAIIVSLGLEYLILAGLFALVCFAMGDLLAIQFSWLTVLGLQAIIIFFRVAFKTTIQVKNRDGK